MDMPHDQLATWAKALMSARADARQIAPISDTAPGFDLTDANGIADRIRTLRIAQGETPVGRKIGFTNRTIWDTYGINAPIWGDIFDSTLHYLGDMPATLSLPALTEPRIEPEIVFGFRAAPEPGMDAPALLGCIDWVAHGFEVVSSAYPGWRFAIADAQAAFGMHAALYIGPQQALSTLGKDPAAALAAIRLQLTDGKTTLNGRGADVLDGPVAALSHLLTALDTAGAAGVSAGDVVTTGTLTDAPPLISGARWRTMLDNAPLPGLDVTFTA